MKNNHRFKRLMPVASAVALGLFCSGNATADIISTGGTLSGVTPATVGTGATSFSGTHVTQVTDANPVTGQIYTADFTDTALSGSISPTALSVHAEAHTFYSIVKPFPQAIGGGGGTIGFNVTQAGTATFSWENLRSNAALRDSLVIKAADGSVVFGCAGSVFSFNGGYSRTGGCEAGADPSQNPSDPLLQQGSISLAAGIYSLSFGVSSDRLVGTADDGMYNFSLNMAPVPLPAGLPLLLGGLATLTSAGAMRRRTQGNCV